MANKSTERGLELKKTALAIPYHTLTNKNDFRAILGYLFKIFKKSIKTLPHHFVCLDKIVKISYNSHAIKN